MDRLTNVAFIAKKHKNMQKIIRAYPKTLRKIYVDFMPQCKPFIRFLKEEKFFMQFFRIVREDGIPECINNDDRIIEMTESMIMRDVLYRTVDLENPKLEKLDLIWVKKMIKYNTDKMKNEINRFIAIAKKYHVEID